MTHVKGFERSKISYKLFSGLNIFLVILVVVACLYPFLNVVAYSLSSNRAILSGWVTAYPIEPQIQSYMTILGRSTIWQAMRITVFITLIGTLLSLALTVMAAYSLSRKRLKGRMVLTFIILFTMYFSGGIVPTFLVVKELGLYNSLASLILPGAINAFYFVVMRSFFSNLPDSLEEAGRLDGANDLKILLVIVLPLSLPILATIGLFYAVDIWNAYFDALLYITDPNKYTLQLKLRQLVFTEELNQLSASAGMAGEGLGQAVMPESLKAAAVVVATLPIIIVYPWLQRYFVKGVMIGSIKG